MQKSFQKKLANLIDGQVIGTKVIKESRDTITVFSKDCIEEYQSWSEFEEGYEPLSIVWTQVEPLE